MRQKLPQFSISKYSGILFFFLLIYNNSFAVKPVHHPTQQMETLSIEDLANTSIKDLERQLGKKINLKEKLFLKILQKKLKKDSRQIYSDTSSVGSLLIARKLGSNKINQFEDGQLIRVKTKGKLLIKGKLKIIDDENISVDGQIIPLGGISNIGSENRRLRIITGAILLLIGISLLIFAFLRGYDEENGNVVIWSTMIGSILTLIGFCRLVLKNVYDHRAWEYNITKKDKTKTN